jgi:hypothetical protein
MAVPTLIVEIAFDHGPYVVSPTWTDVSSDVTHVSIHRGRSDDFDKNFTATANFVLNNNDRKYDPFNSSGTYFGKLTPRRQIRIRGTANGTTYDMFRGFVNGFPVTWADAGKTSTVTVDCFDAMSLLQSTIIKNDYADIYTRSLNPYHYFKCSDPSGNTVIKDFGTAATNLNVSGGQANETLVAKYSLGLALSGTSADVANTNYTKTSAVTPATGDASISFWASFPDSSNQNPIISISYPTSPTPIGPLIEITGNNPTTGLLKVRLNNDSLFDYETRTDVKVSTTIPSHYVVTYTASSGSINIFVNGVNRTGTSLVSPLTGVKLFPTRIVSLSSAVLQEVAMFNYLLSNSQIVNLYQYGAGNKTESTSARAANILALSEVPAGLYNVHSTSVGEISGSPEPNTNIADALYEAMNTEGGYAFVTKSGVIKTVNRTYVSTNSTSLNPQIVVTDTGTDIGYFKDDISIFYDGDNIRNEIVVNYGSSVQETATDSASVSAYGRHSESIDTQMSTSAGAAALASFWLQYYSQLIPTVSELEVGTSANTLAKWQQLLSLELLDRFSFIRTPTVGSQFTQDMLINSIDFDLTPKRWGMKLNGSGRFSPTPPTVSMSAATSVTTNSAVLNGTVSANGLSTGVVFQYSQDGSFGSGVTQVAASPSTVTGQNVAVSATLSGVLDAAYTYYFRIVASNAFVSTTASAASFVTGNAAPSVVASAASSVVYNSATLNGTVDANGTSTTVYFDYQTGSGTFTTGYSSILATQSPVTSNTPVSVSATIGLSASTTYYWRIRATNSVGVTNVSGTAFATPAPVTPVISVLSESHPSTTALTLTAVVNAGGRSTMVYFDYKTGNSTFTGGTFTTVASSNSPISGSSAVNCSVALTGLTMGTRYYWRVRAIGAEDSATSSSTYSDAATAATITSVTPSYAATSASATAVVNYNGLATSVSFQYSTNGGASWSSAFGAVSGITSQTYSVTGYIPTVNTNTTYLIRVSASNDLGGATLNTNSFTTHTLKVVRYTGSGTWTSPNWSNTGAGGIASTTAYYGQLIAGGGGAASDRGGGGGGGGENYTGYSFTLASSMVGTIGAAGGLGANGGNSTVTNFGVTAIGGYAGLAGNPFQDPNGGSSGAGFGGGLGWYNLFNGDEAGGGGGGSNGYGGNANAGSLTGGNGGAGKYPTYAGPLFGGGGGGGGLYYGSPYGTTVGQGGTYNTTYMTSEGSGGYAEFLYYGPNGARSGTGWTESNY